MTISDVHMHGSQGTTEVAGFDVVNLIHHLFNVIE